MKQNTATAHIVMSGPNVLCIGCGEKCNLWPDGKPRQMWEVAALSEAFTKQHRGCAKAAKTSPRCDLCGGEGHDYQGCNEAHGLDRYSWIDGHDTGTSSKTIWCFMQDISFARIGAWGPDAPADPSDFGRCYRLLKLAPEWRKRMSEMSSVPQWKTIAPAWKELTKLYEQEIKNPDGKAPRLYARRCELRGVK